MFLTIYSKIFCIFVILNNKNNEADCYMDR